MKSKVVHYMYEFAMAACIKTQKNIAISHSINPLPDDKF